MTNNRTQDIQGYKLSVISNKLKLGFSLVEIILVMGIIAILTTVGLNNYISLKNSKSLDNMANLLLADITYTMERSKTQESGLQWWMNFQNSVDGNNYYLICSGAYSGTGTNPDCGNGNTVSKRTQIASGLSISFTPTGSLDLVFAKSTGLPTATKSIVVTSAVTTLVPKTITVNSNGRVDLSDTITVPTPPTAPNGLSGTPGDAQVILNWSAPSSNGGAPISNYKIYRSTTSGAETLLSTGGCSGLGNVLACTDTGLTNSTTYFYQASAVNSVGEGTKTAEISTTPVAPTVPTLTTPTSSSVTGTSATLGATVTSNGGATLTARGTCWATTANPTLATGNCLAEGGIGVSAFTHNRTGLTAGTTYFYAGYATNSIGTSYSADDSFTTLSVPPTMVTVAASDIEKDHEFPPGAFVTLNGTGNPNGFSTTGWFRYTKNDPGSCDYTFGTRVPTSGGNALGSGSSAVAYQRQVTGLLLATTYYFCAIGSNSAGTSLGSLLQFTTPVN